MILFFKIRRKRKLLIRCAAIEAQRRQIQYNMAAVERIPYSWFTKLNDLTLELAAKTKELELLDYVPTR